MKKHATFSCTRHVHSFDLLGSLAATLYRNLSVHVSVPAFWQEFTGNCDRKSQTCMIISVS